MNRKLLGKGLPIFILFCLCIVHAGSSASIPNFINYEGMLLDHSGMPFTGSVQLTISLYNHPTSYSSTNRLWTEMQSVSVKNGVLKIKLGSYTPINPDIFDKNTAIYLGIKVNSDAEMAPRTTINSNGFAFNSSYANQTSYVGDIGSPLTLSGSLDISENVAQKINFKVNGMPRRADLYIFGGKFNCAFYTEVGQHTHSVSLPAITSSDFDCSHTHEAQVHSSACGCTSQSHDTRYSLGDHNHIVDYLELASGTTGVNGGTLSTSMKQYLINMQIIVNGQNITSGLLAQAKLSSFGDGTAGHIINLPHGIGPLDLRSYLASGDNLLKFRILAGNGGGGVSYILYVDQ